MNLPVFCFRQSYLSPSQLHHTPFWFFRVMNNVFVIRELQNLGGFVFLLKYSLYDVWVTLAIITYFILAATFLTYAEQNGSTFQFLVWQDIGCPPSPLTQCLRYAKVALSTPEEGNRPQAWWVNFGFDVGLVPILGTYVWPPVPQYLSVSETWMYLFSQLCKVGKYYARILQVGK